MYIIYKLTNNINNKIYFGYTKQSLSARFYGHWYEKRDTIISRSIRKHSKENFTKEIIYKCEDQGDAKFLERFLIFRYQTNILVYPCGNGMNMTNGGEGCEGYKHSKEQKDKWSKERKGRFVGDKHPNYGKHGASKTVYQFTLTGDFVTEYPSTKVAAAAVGSCGANISRCCLAYNGSNTVKGYIFSYDNITPINIQNNSYSKIIQCDMNNNELHTFKSIAEAVRKLKFKDRSGIDKCLMGKVKSAQGYKWKRG